MFGEVIEGANEGVKPDMYERYFSVTEFDWALQVAPNVVDSGKMGFLKDVGEGWGLIPSDVSVIFTDNHDTQRGGAPLTYRDGAMYKLLNMFMIAHIYGYPKVMSSYYFNSHDAGPPSTSANSGSCGDGRNWVCEHRWSEIANLVKWRKAAVKGERGRKGIDNWKSSPDDNGISFSRGGSAFIALNRGGGDWKDSFDTGLPSGTYCNVIKSDDTSSCEKIEVGSDGSATLSVPSMSGIAMHVDCKV